ncbi:MAG: hypothetical protein ACO1PI_09285 [Bacteroidota bacterium]
MEYVIGISPGTRTIGIAIFCNRELIHWQVKTFTGPWSDIKRVNMLTALHRILTKYPVTTLICKVADSGKASEPLQELLQSVQRLCRELHIRYVPCVLEDMVEAIIPSNKRVTREFMADYLVLRYPELSHELTKEKRKYCHHPYYLRLFEAIAAVEFYRHSK